MGLDTTTNNTPVKIHIKNFQSKEQLDSLDGLTPGHDYNLKSNPVGMANFMREASMEKQNKNVYPQYVDRRTFDEA